MPVLRYITLLLMLIPSTSAIALSSGIETGSVPVVLDQLSTECLSCHEDIDNSKNRSHGGHVTGVPYEEYTGVSHKFRMLTVLPSELVFVEGKITCATCHGLDPHDGDILVIDNRGSALCNSCHIM